MKTIDSAQTQTLLLSGMGKLPGTCLGLLRIEDAGPAKQQLADFLETYSPFDLRKAGETEVAQIAFSSGALRKLGLPASEALGFDRAFCEGMTSAFRSRTLGDLDLDHPRHWRWSDGGAAVALWIYAQKSSQAEARLRAFCEAPGSALSLDRLIGTDRLPHVREHFGFRDGISNPRLPRAGQADVNEAGSGDFLFGYRDATGALVEGPRIDGVPFGLHGSYLVLRQLSQDVPAFWAQWMRAADGDHEKAVWLAAKAVGRWPNGMPLRSPHPEPMPEAVEEEIGPMDFEGDSKGLKCPFGSHIRRSAPQDDHGASRLPQHRILRRGRVYGPVCEESAYPKGLAIEPNHLGRHTDAERGIVFACLGTDLARQFEFVQQTWINNPKFRGLHEEVDPITGGQAPGMDTDVFTIPSQPFRYRVCPAQPHVAVRGGGYFFLPGKDALRHLLS